MGIVITVSGYVCSMIEERVTSKGIKMKTFTMAPFGKKTENLYIKCMVLGDHLDNVLAYVKKGSGLLVTGSMQPPEVWVANSGEPKVSVKMFVGTLSFIPRGEKQEKTETIKSEAMIWEDQLKTGESSSTGSIDDDLPF